MDSDQPIRWDGALQGFRLYLGAAGLGLAIFLSSLEQSIVSTSLVTITNDLGGSGQSSWVITSYLLTFTGSLIIWSNCGTIFGVKAALLTSVLLFVAFSGACAGAQELSQLIICRAFQGLGGGGIYSLALFSFVRIVPYEKYDKISSVAGAILSLGLVLGPLFGGAIANSGSWRWVFLCNVPAGGVALALISWAMPAHFPHHSHASADESTSLRTWPNIKTFLWKIDLFGAFLILTACSFIIAALQEGNFEFPWSSGIVIGFFVISGISWIALIWWEWFIYRHDSNISPVFPWQLTSNRVFMGDALGSFTTGPPLTVCVINLPQRFQTVNGSSPIGAGVKLLSFALSCPLGIMACSFSAGRLRVPFCYIALFGMICQVLGLFLFSGIASTTQLWVPQFGYLVLAGLGVGLTVGTFTMLAPLVVDKKDQSIALGIGLQLRMLGGVLGVAASTAILNHYLTSRLSSMIRPEELTALLKTTEAIRTFSPEIQIRVREIYAMAYSMQVKLSASFSVAQLLAIAMIWRRQNIRYSKQ
ncbi:efflux pump antibiotic resistance protein [Aspergillus udagawae]|uniref:Efflux pump antibiotic resistance protein n=1 Tax=Aspergillus udagawae TaxID=91492 RepID=A0ABQ1A5M9_9EURO|nr:efflux pump antibiotic resistance protein [Aspergillus udagawae]GFG19751.1 efflux pump antibiotic resistance protein [Aspergillus udagawae]GFG22587.1 efflux pump antibiotic resistance protein [Aspergillus udagawae]